MKISVANHIYTVLTESAGISSAVGNKIFPIVTKNEVEFPFIVYEKENVAPYYDKMGVLTTDIDMSIYVLAETYSEAERIAEMVANALDKRKAVYEDYQVINAVVTDVPEDYINQTFVQQVRMRFTIK